MKIILPVAGKGTRLRPHTHTKAKSLVQVAGKTVLEHIVSRLLPLGADEYIFITDENGGQIAEFMSAKFPGVPCTYIGADGTPRTGPRGGPGRPPHRGGGRRAGGLQRHHLRHRPGADPRPVRRLRRADLFQGGGGLPALRGQRPSGGGFIVDMVEKPDTPVSRLAQVGLYYLKDGASFMAYLEKTISAGETVKGEYYLPSVFMRMIQEGHRFRAPEIDAWLDCGKPETLLETNRYLLGERHHCHGEAVNSVLIEPVHISEGAVVRNSILGPNVSVAPQCVIEDSIIRDSIINTGSEVREMVLESTILGDNVRLVGGPRRMNIGDHSLIEMEG